jgi:branched-chain amino acid transport system permease protein
MKSMFTIREGGLAHWLIRGVGAALVVGLLLWIPTQGSNSLISQSTDAVALMIAAMALNLVLGYTGLISIGHSAFFGIGAYATAIMITRYGWNPWHTFWVAFVVAFVIGMIVSLPAMRIKGIYLALVTLSLAIIFPQLIKWKKLAWLTGGSSGLDRTTFPIGRRGMRNFEIFGWDPFGDLRREDAKTAFYFWIGVGLAAITYLVCRGVVKSRVGRSLIAIRDNETAAAVMGVNLAMTKALVFGVSAGLCSFAGSLSALRTGNVTPEGGNTTLLGAIAFLIVMVIGGAGTLWGPIIGAIVYTIVSQGTSSWGDDDNVPGLLRPLIGWSEVSPGTGLLAVVLIALMFVAPYGLVGTWKRNIPRLVRVIPRPAGTVVGLGAPQAESRAVAQ